MDLNRDHVAKAQPETQALHDNVMRAYDIDYMIDLHHQGTQSERDGELVSGSILYPTTPNVDPAVLEGSKRLGAVVFDAVDSTGWGHLGRYVGGAPKPSAATASRWSTAFRPCCSKCAACRTTRGNPQCSARRATVTSSSRLLSPWTPTARAIADGSIATADTSFWDTLAEQTTRTSE